MIEQSLVYIYSLSPTRRFIGCGTLVEGGYVATCRHVWDAAKAEAGRPPAAEIEFPRARENGAPVRRAAQLADPCQGMVDPPPDLVLLRPDDIPITGTTMLKVASQERFQAGKGYAIAGLLRGNANAPRDMKIAGSIADHADSTGRREFTGTNPNFSLRPAKCLILLEAAQICSHKLFLIAIDTTHLQ
jgi:hypothetical protein